MRLPKIVKNGLKATGILVILLVGTAFAIPYFFKDKIVEKVKTEINKNINASRFRQCHRIIKPIKPRQIMAPTGFTLAAGTYTCHFDRNARPRGHHCRMGFQNVEHASAHCPQTCNA